MFRVSFIIFFSCIYVLSNGQKNNLIVSIKPLMNKQILELEKEYILDNSTTLRIETLKFYISRFRFLLQDKVVFEEKSKFRLLDWEDPETFNMNIKYPKINFDRISFCIGIDSLTNVSGAMGGDLDPLKGMYWTWQSGYINFKLEGFLNKSKSRNGQFQYHLGGYQYPFNSLQEISFEVLDPFNLELNFLLDQFLNNADLENNSEIMSPSMKAVFLSNQFEVCFKKKND